MTEERQAKVAVIGATGLRHESREARVECFPWNRLKNLKNLADYDIVILDLLSITDQNLQDVETFERVLNEQTVLEILTSKDQSGLNGIIFVLGDPRFSIAGESNTLPMPGAPPYDTSVPDDSKYEIPFLYWTNMEFEWDDRPGDTIERAWEASSGKFKPFADKLGQWRYSLKGCRLKVDVPDEFLPGDALREGLAFEQKALVKNVCWSRYGTSIVFSVKIVAEALARYRGPRSATPQIIPVTGLIYFLPESQLTEEATLEFVLRDLCGVDVSAPEPEWVSHFVAPGQEEVDRQIAELELRIEELHEAHARKVEERAELRKPVRL